VLKYTKTINIHTDRQTDRWRVSCTAPIFLFVIGALFMTMMMMMMSKRARICYLVEVKSQEYSDAAMRPLNPSPSRVAIAICSN